MADKSKSNWQRCRRNSFNNKKDLPIKILNFKSGSKVFDWEIPKVWEIKNAWLKNDKKETILDFKENNLHVVGYSKYVNQNISFKSLKKKIHYLKKNLMLSHMSLPIIKRIGVFV